MHFFLENNLYVFKVCLKTKYSCKRVNIGHNSKIKGIQVSVLQSIRERKDFVLDFEGMCDSKKSTSSGTSNHFLVM